MNSRGLVLLGFFLTALFVGCCWYLATQIICKSNGSTEICLTNFDVFLASPPNEKGDTLAGLAGSLAFLWIIITVLMQGRELAFQREELERMRETQEEQTRLLLAENERQAQLGLDAKVKAMVGILHSSLPDLSFREFTVLSNGDPNKRVNSIAFAPSYSGASLKKFLDAEPRVWADRISKIRDSVSNYCTQNNCSVSSPVRPMPWLACLTQVDSIIQEVNSGASPAVLEWVFYDLKLPYLKKVLNEALDDNSIWAPASNKTKN